MNTSSENNNIIYKPNKSAKVYSNKVDDSGNNINEVSIWKSIENKAFDFSSKPETSVFDVAAYILEKLPSCTTMKLHKLLYYCQAWSLVWDEEALFKEEIEAWANGPVVRDLFYCHQGKYTVEKSDFIIGNANSLNIKQKETIDSVIDYYGSKSAQWLINLTHMEKPWINARKDYDISERGNRVITYAEMADYYSSL